MRTNVCRAGLSEDVRDTSPDSSFAILFLRESADKYVAHREIASAPWKRRAEPRSERDGFIGYLM